MNTLNKKSSRKLTKTPRGKSHSTSEKKITIGIYVDRKLVERTKKRRLNLSKVTEQALSSILDYLEPQNYQTSPVMLNHSSTLNNVEWTEGDLNPRLPPCGGGDHTGLIYRPN